ncbi:hypothetical protein LCGC14_1710850 [marine sediment metagenome]|uniref:Uncharacterized protein n=1 Tax=marine sediment metagenome TaxID=412755 RepID=A0A0F9I2U8_9ZZZZ
MKYLIAIVIIVSLCLLPLVPTTYTTSYTTKIPENYTITESYTEYVPRQGERAVYHEDPARTQWRNSIKTSIEDAIPPVTRPSYYTIEYFTYNKAVSMSRQVTKIRLVDKVVEVELVEYISIVGWLLGGN